MTRIIGVAYGAAAYAFFLVVFLYTIGFVANLPWLPKTIDSGPAGPPLLALAINAALLGVFALQHSVMARPGFKRWWTQFVPPAVERSTYVLAASLAVALLLWQWRPMAGVIWAVEHPAGEVLLLAVSAAGWVVLLIATCLISHFELFGLQQVIDRWRGRHPVPPEFRTPGFYRVVRHPIYLGFILAFWATPRMTTGHLLFAAATTGYILIGIWFEERDLVERFGDEYRNYRRRVPMLVPLPRNASKPVESAPQRQRG